MTRNETARLVHRVREASEERAARFLAEGLGARNSAHERLEMLRAWRHDYANRQQIRMMEGTVSADDLARWRAFLGDLDQVISHQRDLVRQTEDRAGALRQDWQGERMQRRAAERLLERVVRDERQDRVRRDQIETDEVAGRRALVT